MNDKRGEILCVDPDMEMQNMFCKVQRFLKALDSSGLLDRLMGGGHIPRMVKNRVHHS